jgi:hypothetical protein
MTDRLLFRGSRPWAVGASELEVATNVGGHPVLMAIRCRLGAASVDRACLLDTGAAWSVVDRSSVDPASLTASGLRLAIVSRFGVHDGELCAVDVTIPASHGAPARIAATFLVVDGWPGPDVLGFHGFLERLRFAVEPAESADGDSWFYFGRAGDG